MKVLRLIILVVLSVLCFTTAMASDLNDIKESRLCRTELVDSYMNRVLNTFSAYARDYQEACRKSVRKCEQYRRGQRGLYCRTQQNIFVTKRCSSILIDRYGRIASNFTALASGYDARAVQRQACREALRQCSFYRVNRGLHHFQCRARFQH